MNTEWHTVTLAEIALMGKTGLVDGPFGSNLPSSSYTEVGIPVIRGSNLTKGKERFKSEEFVYVSSKTAEALSRSCCIPNDIIFTKKGTLGQIGLIPRDDHPVYLLSSNQMRLRVDPAKADPEFVYYYLAQQNSIDKIIRDSEHTGVPKINLGYVKSFPIALPPVKTQRIIAATLSALDDRIALLRETNATLEAIAQALLKSWFVDFDPVRAKMEGRAPEGMDEATAALFPESFEESALGLVPKAWQVGTLGEHTSYLSRGISPKYIEDGGVIVINQKCIRDFSLDLSKARRHDPSQRKIDDRELLKGDILVNSTGVGTLGRVAQVLFLDNPAIVDSHVTVIRADSSLTWNYLGLSIMCRQSEIEGMGEGSTGQTELSRGKLAALKFLVPPVAVLQNFDHAVLPLRERFSANQTQAQTLATLRDTLLPRLISGQLRLPEAEALLEEIGA